MTLATHVAIATPVPVEPLFRFCQALLGDASAQRWAHEPDDGFGDGVYRNEGGQGLPALLWVSYGLDGPRRSESDEEVIDPTPPHVVMVTFDTGYSYEGPRGANASDLHGWLVAELGLHLDGLGAAWWWQHDFTDEWNEGAAGLIGAGGDSLGNPHG